MAKHSLRFAVRGHYGSRTRPAVYQQAVFGKVWDIALQRGDISGVKLYGQGDRARLMLAYRVIYPDAWNLPEAWTMRKGSRANLTRTGENAFRGGVGGLAFQNGEPNGLSLIATVEQVITEGRGHTIRFIIAKPDSTQKYHRWWYQWWIWRFEIRSGQAYVYRLTEQWTEAQEAALDAIRRQDTIGADEQKVADQIHARIYADQVSISKVGADGWYEGTHEISFIPDDSGRFSVVIEGLQGDNDTDVEDKRITETRKPGAAWRSSPAIVGCNGGTYAWQLGEPEYQQTGSFSLPPIQMPPDVGDSDFTKRFRGSANGGSVETIIEEINEVFSCLSVTLTGSGATSPILYEASAYAPPGSRSGIDSYIFDSNNAKDTNNQPIDVMGDVSFSVERDGPANRASASFSVFNVSGLLKENGFPFLNHPAMHDRLGDLWIGGSRVLAKSLIKTASSNNVRKFDTNSVGPVWAGPMTEHFYTLEDVWSLLDEYVITEQLTGDGMFLSDHIIEILRMTSLRPSEFAGVAEGSGRRLPRAAGGEDPAVQPAMEVSAGEYLRSLLEKFGNGLRMNWRQESFVLGPRDLTIKARFSSSATHDDRYLGTPIYSMMKRMDLPRDFGDSYNVFPVAGGNDIYGQQIVRCWKYRESISNANHESYIGREKPYKMVQDQGLRTVEEVETVARSVASAHGKPGLFGDYESYFVRGLYSEDRVTCDGVLYEIERIPNSSTKDDTMQFAARKVVPMAGAF